MSRSPSPKRLRERTSSTIARPGRVETHQAVSITSRPSETIEPHAGVGGWMPRPRKLSEASVTMKKPIRSVASTKTDWTILGRISVAIIAGWLRPRARAASTYSRVFSLMISPRVRRKNSTQPLKVRARMRLPKPGPMKAIMAMAKMRKGKAMSRSAKRESRVSNQPR